MLAVIGGWGNERTLIRRKRQDADKVVVDTKHVLSKKGPLKVLITIASGEFRISLSLSLSLMSS